MNLNPHAAGGLVVATFLAVAMSGNARPAQSKPQTSASEHSSVKRLTLEGVGNFGEVTPTLYRGGQPKPAGFEGLAKMGVNIVVDVRLTGRNKERKEVNKQ